MRMYNKGPMFVEVAPREGIPKDLSNVGLHAYDSPKVCIFFGGALRPFSV